MSIKSERETVLNSLNCIKGTNKGSTRKAVASLIDLNAQLKMMADRAYPSDQIFKIQQAALNSIKQDLFEQNQVELMELQSQMELLKNAYQEQYKKDYDVHDRELVNYTRKLNIMTDTELKNEANKYKEGKFPATVDPALIEILAGAVKSIDKDEFEGLKKWMNDHRYDEPWIKDDVGSYIDYNINLVSNNLDNVIYEYENKTFPMTIDTLVDFLEYEAKEAEEEDA